MAMKLMSELEQITDQPEAFEQLMVAMAAGEADDKRIREQWQRILSMSARVDTLKRMAETLRILIDKEREAFGILPPQGTGDAQTAAGGGNGCLHRRASPGRLAAANGAQMIEEVAVDAQAALDENRRGRVASACLTPDFERRQAV